MHWGQYAVCRTNDNTFIFNRMLGYNTALYDDIDDKLQFERVNYLSATCYIKYSKHHYTDIQPLANHTEDYFFSSEKDECIVPRSNGYSSPEILGGIHNNLIPKYNLVMSKHNSKVELIATNNLKVHEYQIKIVSYPKIPVLQNYKVIIKHPMKFPSVIDGFATPFSFDSNVLLNI